MTKCILVGLEPSSLSDPRRAPIRKCTAVPGLGTLAMLVVFCLAMGEAAEHRKSGGGAGDGGATGDAGAAPVMGYVVVAKYPHSTDSYTEGFFYRDGLFYEGTGLQGHSQLLAVQPETGKVVRSTALPAEYFGEGIIDWGNYIYQWTWTSQVCFVYTIADLRPVKMLRYEGEGWGMTRTNDEIVTSNGSAQLIFRDPDTFQPVHSINVTDGGRAVTQLNELEYIKGEIYANIWHSDRIARISPRDGHVIAWIDLAGLMPASRRSGVDAVLNGIAYDSAHDRLFVTGKQWDTVFQIKIVPKGTVFPKR